MRRRKFFNPFTSLPVENSVVFLPSLILLLYSFCGQSSLEWDGLFTSHFLKALQQIFFDNPIFGNLLLYPAIYAVVRYLVVRLPVGARSRQSAAQLIKSFVPKWNHRWAVVMAYWMILVLLFCYMTAIQVGILFHSFSHEYIAEVSAALMQLDHTLFGVYPMYALQALGWVPILAQMIIYAYILTPLLLGFLFVVLLFSDTRLFRRFFLVTVFAFYISLPLWYFFPAITPNEMYRHNIFRAEIPQSVSAAIAEHPQSPEVMTHMQTTEAIWIDPEKKTTAVSTLPSMHMVWGIEIALFGYLLARKRFIGLFLIYMIANTLGTMLLLQHYAVDIILGAVVTVLAFLLTSLCFWFEKNYIEDRFSLLPALEFLGEDRRKGWAFLVAFIRSFRRSRNT